MLANGETPQATPRGEAGGLEAEGESVTFKYPETIYDVFLTKFGGEHVQIIYQSAQEEAYIYIHM